MRGGITLAEGSEKELYIVLSQTGSVLSKLIKIYTHKPYSHSSISLQSDLSLMYSFGRIYPYFPLYGGFVKEGPSFGTFKRFPKTQVQVFSLKVSAEEYNCVSEIIEEMLSSDKRYRYNMLGVCYAAFGKKLNRKNCFYCSEFIAMLLKESHVRAADALGNVVHPVNFSELPGARMIYEGNFREFVSKINDPVAAN